MSSPPPEPESRVHTKVTRRDWIRVAVAALADQAIDQLKVQRLAQTLGVSRSSFYWYFQDVAELRAELMALWEHNTQSIVERSARETKSVVEACLGVFECWADRSLYLPEVDESVRDWGRRDASIRERVAEADEARLSALAAMFERHGFDTHTALVRARLLYHGQVGYYTVGTTEPSEARLSFLPAYLEAMAGQRPTGDELLSFERWVRALDDNE